MSALSRIVLVIAILVAIPAIARAHPLIDRAEERYREADFAGALAALDEADAASDLSRADLLRALELRALAHFATDDAALDRDLLALLSLDPAYVPGDFASPRFRARLDAVRPRGSGALALRARGERVAGGASLATEIENDDASLVRAVRIAWRAGAASREIDARETTAPAGEGVDVAWWAIAIGPGGATIATAGSAAEPLEVAAVAVALEVPPLEETPRASGDDSGLAIGIGVALGVAAIVGVIVAIVVATSGPSDQTQILLPTVERM